MSTHLLVWSHSLWKVCRRRFAVWCAGICFACSFCLDASPHKSFVTSDHTLVCRFQYGNKNSNKKSRYYGNCEGVSPTREETTTEKHWLFDSFGLRVPFYENHTLLIFGLSNCVTCLTYLTKPTLVRRDWKRWKALLLQAICIISFLSPSLFFMHNKESSHFIVALKNRQSL